MLHGVTICYNVLHGVTRCYNVLHEALSKLRCYNAQDPCHVGTTL